MLLEFGEIFGAPDEPLNFFGFRKNKPLLLITLHDHLHGEHAAPTELEGSITTSGIFVFIAAGERVVGLVDSLHPALIGHHGQEPVPQLLRFILIAEPPESFHCGVGGHNPDAGGPAGLGIIKIFVIVGHDWHGIFAEKLLGVKQMFFNGLARFLLVQG